MTTALRILRRRAQTLALASDRIAYDHGVRNCYVELRGVLGWADTLKTAHRVERILRRMADRSAQRDLFGDAA